MVKTGYLRIPKLTGKPWFLLRLLAAMRERFPAILAPAASGDGLQVVLRTGRSLGQFVAADTKRS